MQQISSFILDDSTNFDKPVNMAKMTLLKMGLDARKSDFVVLHGNNKGAEQPAHLCNSLTSTYKGSVFLIFSVAKHIGKSPT